MKKKLSVLSDSDETELKKLAKKDRGKAVTGKPDQTDINNINHLLRLYEQSNPGLLKRMKHDYDLQKGLGDVHKPVFRGLDSKELTFSFWMPRDLQEFMEQYYPTIWSNKSHAEWFIKNYPIFKS